MFHNSSRVPLPNDGWHGLRLTPVTRSSGWSWLRKWTDGCFMNLWFQELFCCGVQIEGQGFKQAEQTHSQNWWHEWSEARLLGVSDRDMAVSETAKNFGNYQPPTPSAPGPTQKRVDQEITAAIKSFHLVTITLFDSSLIKNTLCSTSTYHTYTFYFCTTYFIRYFYYICSRQLDWYEQNY